LLCQKNPPKAGPGFDEDHVPGELGDAVNGGSGLWFAQDSYADPAAQGYVTVIVPVTLPVVGPGPWYALWGPIVAIATSASGYSSEISPVTNDWIFGDGFESAP